MHRSGSQLFWGNGRCFIKTICIKYNCGIVDVDKALQVARSDCSADMCTFVYQSIKALACIDKNENRWTRCGNVSVSNTNHLTQLWMQQLQQINSITGEISQGIAVIYETPDQLIAGCPNFKRTNISWYVFGYWNIYWHKTCAYCVSCKNIIQINY